MVSPYCLQKNVQVTPHGVKALCDLSSFCFFVFSSPPCLCFRPQPSQTACIFVLVLLFLTSMSLQGCFPCLACLRHEFFYKFFPHSPQIRSDQISCSVVSDSLILLGFPKTRGLCHHLSSSHPTSIMAPRVLWFISVEIALFPSRELSLHFLMHMDISRSLSFT